MASEPHPDQQQLAAYAHASLPESAAEAVADHLERCPTCEATVTSLERAGDTVLSVLRQAPVSEAFSDEPECRQAVERIRVLEPQEATVTTGPAEGPGPEATVRTPAPRQLREYELLEKLGQGGMGTVYKALHTKLDKLVALKVLPAAAMSDAELVARFEREMKAVGKLEHPNIVRAMDAGCHEGTHFLVMEYVDGLDLSEIVKRCGKLRIADACEVIRQAAIGLRHADEHALVHRDIKPSNLVLNADGEVKILDLGLALLQADPKPGEEATGRGRAMGTIDYIAPEQVRDSHRVDIRADLYSLGCTFYKLLTGQSPFSGPRYENTFDKMMAHLNDPIPPVRQIRPDVPEKLVAVLDRMVAKDRDARYVKPGQVADDLKLFCPGCDLAGLLMQARKEADTDTLGQERLPSPSGGGPGGKDAGQEKPLAAGRQTQPGPGAGVAASPALGAGLPTPPKPGTARSPEPPGRASEPSSPRRPVGREEGGVRRPAPSAQGPALSVQGPAARSPTPSPQVPTPFDPYHKWLGIPPAEQPPNHYRLLGIPLFEGDRDVIQAAAERQTVFLRSVALGKHSKESQRLLNEVHQAKLRLLTPEEKAAYDAGLRQELAAKAALGAGLPTSPDQPTAGSPTPTPAEDEGDVFARLRAHLGRVPRLALVASACAAAVVLLGVIYITTNKGTVKIVLSDPTAEVEVKVDGNQIDIAGLKNPLRLSIGEHALEVTSGEFQTVTDRFVIRRGQEVVLSVKLVPKEKPVAAQAATQSPRAPTSPVPSPAVAPFDEKKAKEHQEAWANYLGVPVEIANSIGMKLAIIPPGEFMMGSPKELIEKELKAHADDQSEKIRLSPEGPEHRVRITKPFYLGVTEVTQEQYGRVVGTNPSAFSATGKGKAKAKVVGQDTRRLPVDNVSWDEATEFCDKLSAMPQEQAVGRVYCLPTEAQWECACRAGTTTKSFCGEDERTWGDYAWFRENSGEETHPVGQLKTNPWGLYDICGNVWEWCQDSYEKDYYAKSPTDDPTGPLFGPGHMLRGGCWYGPAWHCGSASRLGVAHGSRFHTLGLRVSLVLSDKQPTATDVSSTAVPTTSGPNAPPVTSAPEVPRVPATTEAAPRWLGYDLGGGEPPKMLAEVAPYTNLAITWLWNDLKPEDALFGEARRRGVKLVLAFSSGSSSTQEYIDHGLALWRANRDVVIGGMIVNVDQKRATLVPQIKQAAPEAQLWMVPVKRQLHCPIPDAVDVVVLSPADFDSPATVQEYGEQELPEYLKRIDSRRVVFNWHSGNKSTSGAFPECQAGTFRAVAELVEKHRLGGAFFVSYGRFGNHAGIQTRPDLIAEIKEIGKQWRIGSDAAAGTSGSGDAKGPHPNPLPKGEGTDAGKPVMAQTTQDADRKAAEWVLGIGGSVGISIGGAGIRQLDAAESLPAERFTLVRVILRRNARVTDEGLKNLAGLASLRSLLLNQTEITDAGCTQLKDFATLMELSLICTGITDEGLRRLTPLTGLAHLRIGGTRISEAGLECLGEFTGLEDLGLAGLSWFSDAQLQRLPALVKVSDLDLSRTSISDKGLVALKQFRKLKILRLRSTAVSDAGLETLREVKSLVILSLGGTRATAAGVARLQAALPHCKIETDIAVDGGPQESLDDAESMNLRDVKPDADHAGAPAGSSGGGNAKPAGNPGASRIRS